MEQLDEQREKNEKIWNDDLLIQIRKDLKKDFPEYNVIKGKVLKDIFLSNDNKRGYSLQLGFVDQDVVIYRETMDISEFSHVKNIVLHNFNKAHDEFVIPRIICELKFNGINSHGLITYSSYASDIKSIFPECKYFLLMRFKRTSTENKLFRHGRYFDKILSLDDATRIKVRNYKPGQFISELKIDKELKNRYKELVCEIKDILKEERKYFIK